jgi:ribosomal protein S18 acetylase RimI-like enzyme
VSRRTCEQHSGRLELTIRPATQDDLETVRELWEALYDECPEPEHHRKGWEDVADDVRRGIAQHVSLSAAEDGEPVGFLLAHARTPRVGYVSDLYVRPARRRSGLATALLRDGAARLRRQVVELDVDASNDAALAFYERVGFHRQSSRLTIDTKELA